MKYNMIDANTGEMLEESTTLVDIFTSHFDGNLENVNIALQCLKAVNHCYISYENDEYFIEKVF